VEIDNENQKHKVDMHIYTTILNFSLDTKAWRSQLLAFTRTPKQKKKKKVNTAAIMVQHARGTFGLRAALFLIAASCFGLVQIATAESPTVVGVRVSDYYLAYVAADAEREPTADEYSFMIKLTSDFFEKSLTALYADRQDLTFLGLEIPQLASVGFNYGVPNERFNIIMYYDHIDLMFTENSIAPSASEAFALLRDMISPEYILDYVRTAVDTPFVSTNEVIFRASTGLPGQEVRLPASWLAYVSGSVEVPTVEAYDLVFANTMAYFNESLRALFADQDRVMFLEVAALLTDVGHNQGIPEERFNILLTLDNIMFTFAPDSEVPTETEAFGLVQRLITADYILDVVRTVNGTPFESVTEVFFQVKTDDTTADPDPDPSTSGPDVGFDVPSEGGAKGAKQHKNNPKLPRRLGPRVVAAAANDYHNKKQTRVVAASKQKAPSPKVVVVEEPRAKRTKSNDALWCVFICTGKITIVQKTNKRRGR
jgi:hypothetical protein